MCRKRVKVPKYRDEAAIREAREHCRKLYNLYKNLHFVLDDKNILVLRDSRWQGIVIFTHQTVT